LVFGRDTAKIGVCPLRIERESRSLPHLTEERLNFRLVVKLVRDDFRSSHEKYRQSWPLPLHGVDRNGSLAEYNVPEFISPMTAMCNETRDDSTLSPRHGDERRPGAAWLWRAE